MEVIKVGMVGLGTVGTGVYRMLKENRDIITKKVGREVRIVKILVRDREKDRSASVPKELITFNPSDILENDEIDIVIEVMGSVDLAMDYITRALNNKKQVITANKDLIALHEEELSELAYKNGRDLFFEASVAGGIPIIRTLKEDLAGNRIMKIMGIVNGTTNYILTKMTNEGRDYEDVLKEAMALGYAESDPTADVEGLDAARKLAILGTIAFDTKITFNDVYVEGISRITKSDICYANELGYVIKLLAIGSNSSAKTEVRVHPVMIPKSHPLAAVNDVFNAVFVEGNAVGEAMFYGRGAGELPTASAVLGDLVAATKDFMHDTMGSRYRKIERRKAIKDISEVRTAFYLRMKVLDVPGVFAKIATVFGDHDVSLALVRQEFTDPEGHAEIVIVTHLVRERKLRESLKVLDGMDVVDKVSSVIRVEGVKK
jgi:homoserine dehydrogenase